MPAVPPADATAQTRRKGTLLSWIRGHREEAAARENGTAARNDMEGFELGDAPGALRKPAPRATENGTSRGERPAVSPLDFLSDGQVVANIQGEIERLQALNRKLREQLDERTAAYEALRETETRYRTLIHDAPIALVETDPVGTITYANPAAAALLACPENEVVGKPIWHAAASEEILDTLRELFLARGRLRDAEPQPPIVVQMRRPDATLRDVEIAHGWKTDDRDRIVGSMVRLLDVTERVLGEAELKASAGVYRDLFENAPAMLLTVDAKTTTILECNRAVLDATGYTRSEILDRSIFDLYDPGYIEEAAEHFRAFLHSGEMRDVELCVRRKSGQILRVLETTSAVADPGGAILACRTTWHAVERRVRRPPSAEPKTTAAD